MSLKFYTVFLSFLVFWAQVIVAQPNVALGRNATSSSNENGSLIPGNAVDGNMSTRWSSSYSNNQWIAIDLLDQYDFTEVKLFWETALGKDFNIEVSDDGVIWTLAKSITGNTVLNNTIDISGNSGRFVRMYGLTRGTNYGFSLYEFEVYGTLSGSQPVINLARAGTYSASSYEIQNGVSHLPEYAFDGFGQNVGSNGKAYDQNSNEYQRWGSYYNTPSNPVVDNDQWIAVDLGAKYEITEVRLYWEAANGKDFDIEVSVDGVNWTTAAGIRNNPANQYTNIILIDPSVEARHVRMKGIERNLTYGYSLYEFEVYGPNSTLPIQLNSFSAVKKGSSVQLNWNASMDAESRFNVQRSDDGINFNTIGTLYFPTGTNGLSNDYHFTDESPLAGVNYYRLDYTETGEMTLYSDVRSVRFDEQTGFRISPNPVSGSLIQVELAKGVQNRLTMRLLTVTGRVIQQQEVNGNGKSVQMNLNGAIPSGTYILQVLDANRTIHSKQIVISR